MKATINLLLILVLSGAAFGQTKKTDENVFPESDSEFTVVFPGTPAVKAVTINGKSRSSARFQNSREWLLRAESLRLTEPERDAIKKKDDLALGEIAFNNALAIGLTGNVKVTTTALGRCAQLRANKTVKNISMTYDLIYCWGKTDLITLYAQIPSRDYPASEVSNFLDSLSLRNNKPAVKGNTR